MSKKNKAKAAEIRRRLIDDDRDPSPFAGIKLVEKKEEKKPQQPVKRKSPGEIVKGYDPSASFADILYSFEHTGNPYQMPKSKAGKSSVPTDFGAILDKWEGRSSTPKKSNKEIKKSEYKPSRSFADILRQYESGDEEPARKTAAPERKPEKQAVPEKKPEVSEKEAEKVEETTLFRKMEEDDEVSSAVSWTIFGGKNESFVRPEVPEKEEEPVQQPVEEKKSEYKPSRSFSDILTEFEGHKQQKRTDGNTSEEAAESIMEDSFSRQPENGEKRSETAVWSVFGGNDGARRTDSHLPTLDPSSFGKSLKKFEDKTDEKTFEDYIREKGDDEKKKEVLTISKLRAMMPQSTLDLHGMTVEETDKAVHEFIEDCHKHGLRKISIITGKGLHSEDGVGVLRQYVSTLLDSSSFVSEKANAPISAGGAGAFWIILKA